MIFPELYLFVLKRVRIETIATQAEFMNSAIPCVSWLSGITGKPEKDQCILS